MSLARTQQLERDEISLHVVTREHVPTKSSSVLRVAARCDRGARGAFVSARVVESRLPFRRETVSHTCEVGLAHVFSFTKPWHERVIGRARTRDDETTRGVLIEAVHETALG